jgi:hypothetical protein
LLCPAALNRASPFTVATLLAADLVLGEAMQVRNRGNLTEM